MIYLLMCTVVARGMSCAPPTQMPDASTCEAIAKQYRELSKDWVNARCIRINRKK
jgi:hypothetical protein